MVVYVRRRMCFVRIKMMMRRVWEKNTLSPSCEEKSNEPEVHAYEILFYYVVFHNALLSEVARRTQFLFLSSARSHSPHGQCSPISYYAVVTIIRTSHTQSVHLSNPTHSKHAKSHVCVAAVRVAAPHIILVGISHCLRLSSPSNFCICTT